MTFMFDKIPKTTIELTLNYLMFNYKDHTEFLNTINCIQDSMKSERRKARLKDEKGKKFVSDVGLWSGIDEAIDIANYDDSDTYYNIFKPMRWFSRRIVDNKEKSIKFLGKELFGKVEKMEDMGFQEQSCVMDELLRKIGIESGDFE